MAWYLTSAFKPDKPVVLVRYVPHNHYLIRDGKRKYTVPFDQLEERPDTLEDLL